VAKHDRQESAYNQHCVEHNQQGANYHEHLHDVDDQQQLALQEQLTLQQQESQKRMSRKKKKKNSANSSHKNSVNSSHKKSSGEEGQEKRINKLSRELCLLISVLVIMILLAGGIVTWVLLVFSQEDAPAVQEGTPAETPAEIPAENLNGDTKGENHNDSQGLGFLSPGTQEKLGESVPSESAKPESEQSESDQKASSDVATGKSAVGKGDPTVAEGKSTVGEEHGVEKSGKEEQSAVGKGESTVGEGKGSTSRKSILMMMLGAGAFIGTLLAFHDDIWKLLFGGKNAVGIEDLVEGKDAVGGNLDPDGSLVATHNDPNSDPNSVVTGPDAQAAAPRNIPRHVVHGGDLKLTKLKVKFTDGNGNPKNKDIETDKLESEFTVADYSIEDFKREFMASDSDWAIWKLEKFDQGGKMGWANEKHPAYNAEFVKKFDQEFARQDPRTCQIVDTAPDDSEMPIKVETAILDERPIGPGVKAISRIRVTTEFKEGPKGGPKTMKLVRKVRVASAGAQVFGKDMAKDNPLRYTTTIEGEQLDGSLKITWTSEMNEVNQNMDKKILFFHLWTNGARPPLLDAWKFQVEAMISHLRGQK